MIKPDSSPTLPVFALIDRTVSGHSYVDPEITSYIQRLQMARSEGSPICLQIADRLRNLKGKRVFLFTGFVVPKLYPNGENDGPLGALALARALERCGLIPEIWVDPQLLDTGVWLAAELGIELPIHPIDLTVLNQLPHLPNAAIAIEKPGQNHQGVMHTFDGIAIQEGSIPIDSLLQFWHDQEILTIGIGDRGNEVGFGRLEETVRKLSPSAETCQCGCGGGVVSSTPTELFLPAAVSNWGAYGIAATLAILEGDARLLHLPVEEERLLRVAAVRGCVDGVHRQGGFGVDGLSGEVSIAIVRDLQTLALQAIRSANE